MIGHPSLPHTARCQTGTALELTPCLEPSRQFLNQLCDPTWVELGLQAVFTHISRLPSRAIVHPMAFAIQWFAT